MSEPEKPDIPHDVRDWLFDMYTPAGVAIWLAAYCGANSEHRERMIRVARADAMGT